VETICAGTEINDKIAAVQKGIIQQHANISGHMFLNVVDSMLFPFPYTNVAAKAVWKQFFSLQLQFGYPLIFFTIVPDDSCSLIITKAHNYEPIGVLCQSIKVVPFSSRERERERERVLVHL